MKLHLLLLLLIVCLAGCGKLDIYTSDPTFNITNSSSGIVKQVDVKVQSNGKTMDAISYSNFDINKTETKALKLSDYDIKGDAGYIALVTLSDGTKMEKTFGYVTNGSDSANGPYNIVITNTEILLK